MHSEKPFGLNSEFYNDLLVISSLEGPEGTRYFHYTNVGNCLKMLNNTDHVYDMWASHLCFLNDKEEFISGETLIKKQLLSLMKKNRIGDIEEIIGRFHKKR